MYDTMQTENDERIITHGKSAFAAGFIVMILMSAAIMVMYQFEIKLNRFDSAIIIMISGVLSCMASFIYKLFRN